MLSFGEIEKKANPRFKMKKYWVELLDQSELRLIVNLDPGFVVAKQSALYS